MTEPSEWKRAILAALADPEAWQHPGASGFRAFTIFAIKLLGWMGLLLLVLNLVVIVPGLVTKNSKTEAAVGLSLLAISLFLWTGLAVPRILKMLMSTVMIIRAGKPREAIIKARRPPVFYLRSFKFDEITSRIPLWMRLTGFVTSTNKEMLLAMNVTRRAPLLAIGKPGEPEPPPGAARFYVRHESWQGKVGEVAPHCSMVLWATGLTEGLRWEMRYLVENVNPEKLVLWLHVHVGRRSRRSREAEWKEFIEAYREIFPKPLPMDVQKARFIVFERDWSPRCIPEPGRRYTPWQRFNNLGGFQGFNEVLAEKVP